MAKRVQKVAQALLWMAGALVIAAGSAGIIVGADHPPGDATRPELTSRADAAMRPGLDRLDAGLRQLEQEVTALGRTGRTALTHLSARRAQDVRDALDEGAAIATRIDAQRATLAAEYAALPYAETSDAIGDRVRARVRAIAAALDTVGPLVPSWERLTSEARPAVRLMELLERHDRQTFAATLDGNAERYGEALEGLEAALETISEAEELRDQVARDADVETLGEWLDRHRRYDEALMRLYELLEESNGAPTDEAEEAFTEVQSVREFLPENTQALVIVMADLGQASLNQAVIEIEQARGALTRATSTLD